MVVFSWKWEEEEGRVELSGVGRRDEPRERIQVTNDGANLPRNGTPYHFSRRSSFEVSGASEKNCLCSGRLLNIFNLINIKKA
jgi:hypothetical protein